MTPNLDRRTYDLLRLVGRHGPIGSIQLVELMDLYGYDIKDRTIRLLLSDLDDAGLTEKVPGQGRQLTEQGRQELTQGDINGRLEHIRSKIATLASRVTYDPADDVGELVASAIYLPEAALGRAHSLIEDLNALPLGPFTVNVAESSPDEPGAYRILTPSSITLDGVLLSAGVDSRLATACVLEYEPTSIDDQGSSAVDVAESSDIADESRNRSWLSGDDTEPSEVTTFPDRAGGQITRYIDVINGEGSTIDVMSLLIEAGRTDVLGMLVDESTGRVVGDAREFPVNQLQETRMLTWKLRDSLGGAYQFERPRERKQLPTGESGWAFSSLTYAGPGEIMLAAFAESELATSWDTFYGIVPRREFDLIEQRNHLDEAD